MDGLINRITERLFVKIDIKIAYIYVMHAICTSTSTGILPEKHQDGHINVKSIILIFAR